METQDNETAERTEERREPTLAEELERLKEHAPKTAKLLEAVAKNFRHV